MTAHLCGKSAEEACRTLRSPDVAGAPRRMKRQASNVSSSSGITSMAEKKAPNAMYMAGVPLK
jgi:hypothetical protein